MKKKYDAKSIIAEVNAGKIDNVINRVNKKLVNLYAINNGANHNYQQLAALIRGAIPDTVDADGNVTPHTRIDSHGVLVIKRGKNAPKIDNNTVARAIAKALNATTASDLRRSVRNDILADRRNAGDNNTTVTNADVSAVITADYNNGVSFTAVIESLYAYEHVKVNGVAVYEQYLNSLRGRGRGKPSYTHIARGIALAQSAPDALAQYTADTTAAQQSEDITRARANQSAAATARNARIADDLGIIYDDDVLADYELILDIDDI